MLKALLAAGLAAALPLVPANAQEDEVGYESALRCGAVIGFFSGVVEEEDPELADGMSAASEVWFTMGALRADSEEQLGADVDRLLGWITSEFESRAENEAELNSFIGAELDTCNSLRGIAHEEYNAVETGLAAMATAEEAAE